MKKMLIATDYDGTLRQNGVIDAQTRDAIDRWRKSGRFFGVVTGRGIDFYDTAREEGLPFDYLIVCTGSLILGPDKHILYESLIPAKTFAEIEHAMALYPDVVDYNKSSGTPRHHYYATFPSQKRALQVQKELLKQFGDTLSIFVNGPHINIGNCGTGKAQGVLLVLQQFALPADSVAVVGDDFNDLEMILAHDGWAVESGRKDVVAQSPHTCKSVGDLIDSLL